jgi:N-methylhydantoinase A/oxoprolinase/acetone carboxylase beta subunit
MSQHPVRIGIDVGGTFTDAVAVDARTFALIGQVKVPTSHDHPDGVAHGILAALRELQTQTGIDPGEVSFLAHGTTQATNALLEGDVATVGVVGIGRGFESWATGRLKALAKLQLTPGRGLPVRYAALRSADDPIAVKAAVAKVVEEGAEVVVAVQPFSVDDPVGEQAVVTQARFASPYRPVRKASWPRRRTRSPACTGWRNGPAPRCSTPGSCRGWWRPPTWSSAASPRRASPRR